MAWRIEGKGEGVWEDERDRRGGLGGFRGVRGIRIIIFILLERCFLAIGGTRIKIKLFLKKVWEQ